MTAATGQARCAEGQQALIRLVLSVKEKAAGRWTDPTPRGKGQAQGLPLRYDVTGCVERRGDFI
ncbi:MAG: hypothetical protein ACE5IY_04310 [bacterium]